MENKELSFKKNTLFSDIAAQSSCDYTLPDYKTDVRKVLYTTASVMPSSSFIDSAEICASGIVNYSVIYLDTENKMCGAEFTSDYDFSVKCSDGSEDFFVDTALASFSVRLVGPRKFSAKSTLISSVDTLGTELISERGDAFSEGVERDIKQVSVMKRQRFSSSERTLAEKIADFDGIIADDVRVIYSSAKVKPQSVAYSDGGIDIKGTVEVLCLAECASSLPERYTCSLPFDERIDAAELSEDAYLIADGAVSSLRVSVNPAEFGCNMTADVIAELFVTATDTSDLTLTADAYSTKGETAAELSEISFDSFVSSISDTSHAQTTVEREALGLSEAREIVFTDAKIKTDSISVNNGELVFDGELHFLGIASEPQDDGSMSYVNFKHSFPFYKNIKLKQDISDTVAVSCRAEVSEANALFDKDSTELCASVELTLVLSEKKRESYVSSLEFSEGEREENRPSRITVYYPSKGDTLFGIAKKFRTTARAVAADNSLTESVASRPSDTSVLGGVRKLIIR